MKRAVSLAALATRLGLAPHIAMAHKPSDTLLELRGNARGVEGRWQIALRDLDHAVDLDADGSGGVTGSELTASAPEIVEYALAHLRIEAAGARCLTRGSLAGIAQRTDGVHAVLALDVSCRSAPALTISYDLFFDLDAQHRGLLRWDGPAGPARALFRKDDPKVKVALSRRVGLAAELAQGRPQALLPVAALLVALALVPWVWFRRRRVAATG